MKKTLNFFVKIFLVASVALVPLLGFAEEAVKSTNVYLDMSLEDLLNVQITTASRSSQSVKDTPISIYVITRDEILNNNYRSLGDALKNAPSISTSKISTAFFGEQFAMKGFGGWYTKVLMNGVPYSPAGQQYPSFGEDINLKNVERIEIVYGPASALYGADAVAGVINIITMNPDKTTARGEVIAGEKGYINGNAYAYTSILEDANKIKFGVYANYSKQDDYKNKGVFVKVSG